MLEKVLSSHVLWYNDEGVYIRAFLQSAHGQVKSGCGTLTRPVNPEAITPECKDLAASFIHHGLREVLCLTDMFDEFHRDLLYQLECRFPGFECSAKAPLKDSRYTLPSLCLLQALEVVLVLQLCNESIVGSKLSFSGKVLGYWRRNTVLLGLIRCHDKCVDALISCSSVRRGRLP